MRHKDLLNDVVIKLKSYPEVIWIVLVWSLADDRIQEDRWSDIDLKIAIKEWSNLEDIDLTFLNDFGDIFSYTKFFQNSSLVYRVCYSDFRKIDISLHIWNIDILWKSKILYDGTQNSNLMESLSFLEKSIWYSPLERKNDIEKQFWVISSVVVWKIMRKDFLIAYHLLLEQVKLCVELKMIERDIDDWTDVHREWSNIDLFVFNELWKINSNDELWLLDILLSNSNIFCTIMSSETNQNKKSLLEMIVEEMKKEL